MDTQTERHTHTTYQTPRTAAQGTNIEGHVCSHSIGRGGRVCPTLINSGRRKWGGDLYWSLTYASYLPYPWFLFFYYYLRQSACITTRLRFLFIYLFYLMINLWFLKEKNKIYHPMDNLSVPWYIIDNNNNKKKIKHAWVEVNSEFFHNYSLCLCAFQASSTRMWRWAQMGKVTTHLGRPLMKSRVQSGSGWGTTTTAASLMRYEETRTDLTVCSRAFRPLFASRDYAE